MRISNVRICQHHEPMGYDLSDLRVAWVLEQMQGASLVAQRIEVALDEEFTQVVWQAEGVGLDSLGTRIGLSPEPRTRYHVRVVATADDGSAAEATTFFETGKLGEPWSAQWISTISGDDRAPRFTRDFRTEGSIARARLYACGLGLFHAMLNGREVSNELLAPYYSDYHTEAQYLTYDVTGLITGENELAFELGNGWYKGVFGLHRKPDNFGDRYVLIAELHLEYEDGRHEVVTTDASWTYRGSDVAEDGIYDGEVIDHLLWDQVDNPVSPAVVIEPPCRLVERRSLPVVPQVELPVVEVIHTPAGETVLDFGQNFAGYVEFSSARLPRGTKVVLDFGEILQEGNFYNANYRHAKSQFTYVADGHDEVVGPHFTYFGFRYCRVTGWPLEVEPTDFVGRAAFSLMEQTGSIETGNPLVNRLFQNALWGQRSNSVDFPTDCPQRDERLGWTGDAQVFAGTACYNMDAAAFYAKFAHDLRVEQQRYEGIVPGVIPVLDGAAPIYSSVWGDIATIMPAVLFEHYGDKALLAQQYPLMRDWVDRVAADDEARGTRYLYDFGDQLGDWLALDGRTEQSMNGGTDEYFIGSNYWAMSIRSVADAADALGYEDDARRYRELYGRVREAILNEWFTSSGRLAAPTQTGYVVALMSGIYPSKEKVVEGLRDRLYKDCFRLTCGFVGAPVFCRVLCENGMAADALRVFMSEDYPGWLHCVRLGATTIWERWNSVLDDGNLSGTDMNSLNHYAYGAVVEFMYRNLAGLRAAAPGFRRVAFEPVVERRLGHLRASYRSASGTWESSWEVLENGELHVTLAVPYGCSACVRLPYHPDDAQPEVGAGTYEWQYVPTVDLLARYDEGTLFKDMLDDPEAMAAIREELGLLAFYLDIGAEDYLYETLSTISHMEYLGFRPEKVGKLRKRLLALWIS